MQISLISVLLIISATLQNVTPFQAPSRASFQPSFQTFKASSQRQVTRTGRPTGRPTGALTGTRLNVAQDVQTTTPPGIAQPPKLVQRWRKSTKQLATLGPASNTKEMIEKLFLAGADVFRLNFSHGSQEEKLVLLNTIREIEEKYSHPIAILGDLQGPKLRVGQFSSPEGVKLQTGSSFRFDLNEASGDDTRVMLPHPEIIAASEIGHVLLIDDGKMKMTVTDKGEGYLICNVDVGGKIKDRKGVNTPDSVLEISPLTPKDRSDLEYMLKIGVDWVALSFVQQARDIVEINELIKGHLKPGQAKPAVMAKIEKPSCFFGNELENIIDLCDGIMVARGDLGVECPPEDVPILQKQIINACKDVGKPVVVATQMLESMIESPTPTRAEASDVATAIFDGADAIMLSAESAAGDFPVESVEMQQRIINRVEADSDYVNQLDPASGPPSTDATDAITLAARQVANSIDAKSLVCFTLRGSTVLRASKGRPSVPILAITPFKNTARQLALSWGVYAAVTETEDDEFSTVLRNACRAALQKGLVTSPDDLLVVTAGLPFGTPGAANVIRVVPAAGPECWDGVCRID
mmetsp:Transcript_24583/g.46203  ORF Transcript_24583/g.46203 Transcript_24583/m.46203 type:complete len:581 (-) Transcript_24583:73-1815(-)